MCGIAGIIGLESVSDAPCRISKMLQRLEHRGPDASGIFEASNAVLGHQRLSIIDLSNSGNQPFHSQNGRFTIVFNGEIYNYRELRSQLSDYNFITNTDTEVLLAAYMRWGNKCLQSLNGMFAFAIWDAERETTFIARDRLGIKPLYYAQSQGAFVFASEVRAMLASGLVEPKLNRSKLSDYLLYQTVHAPHTLIESVKMLMPGHYLEISDNEVNTHQYWVPWQTPHSDRDEFKVKKQVRELLTSSIEARLVADVPFGAFLSGGIDSSLVVTIMSQVMDRSVDTFNVSFDESEYSEARYARMIAEKYACNHHEILLKPDDFLNSLPEALAAVDHPSGDGPNTWIVSRETKRQGVTMALSGLGGDELFAGYDLFKRIPEIADKEWLLSFPKELRSLVAWIYKTYKPGMPSEKMAQVLTSDYFDLKHLYPLMRKVLLEPQVSGLLHTKSGGNAVFETVANWEEFHDFESLAVLSRISVAEMSTYMQNVLLRDTDQMSMAHALEVRVPFLDHRLVEYMVHVSDELKFPHRPKRLLVESFQDLLPNEIVDRPKMGFVLPWERWMRGELKSFCEERLSALGEHDAFHAGEIQKLWSTFLSSEKLSWSRLWPLVVLSDWMMKNDVQ